MATHDHDRGAVVELERAVWQALVDGDPAVDRELLAPDFVGLYPTSQDTPATGDPVP